VSYRDHLQSITVNQIPYEGLQSEQSADPYHLQPIREKREEYDRAARLFTKRFATL